MFDPNRHTRVQQIRYRADGTPDFGEHVDTDYMTGVAKVKGKVKILLDLDRVLGADGTISLKAA